MAHEFVHVEDHCIKGLLETLRSIELGSEFKNASELWAVIKTNIMAKELGEAIRYNYSSDIETVREQGDVTSFINNQ